MKVFIIIMVCLVVAGCDNATASKIYPDEKTIADIEQVEADVMKAEAEVMITDFDVISDTVVVDSDVEVADNQQPDDAPGYKIDGNTVIDQTTGDLWQRGSSAEMLNHEQAVSYCDNLVIGDITHWQVPTISQLRTLIRGCETSMVYGKCGVTDTCNSDKNCHVVDDCQCIHGDAPFIDKTVWVLPKDNYAQFHSNTENPDSMPIFKSYWIMAINNANITMTPSTETAYAKCVR